MMTLDFSRCRKVWVPPDPQTDKEGFWSPPPPHVKVGVEWIIKNPYMLLGDDMGGMKSAQAMIAAQFLHDMDLIDRVIVIAPAAVAPKVWFDLDLGQLREQVFEDKRNIVSHYHAKIKQWAHGPEDAKPLKWIVSNYEYIRNPKNLAALLPYCGPKTFLILDESSAVRTWDSAQTEACMTLRWQTNARKRPILGLPRCGRILEMNGTPVAESPLDMFSQGNLLHPDILDCRYVSHYKARYAVMTPVLSAHRKNAQGQAMPVLDKWNRPVLTIKPGEDGWTNLQDLQQRFAPYVLRREAKELGIDFALPPVGFDVPLTDATWRVYQEMKREMVVWLKSGVATAAQAGVKMIRLAQITSGFIGGVEVPNIGELDAEVPDVLFDGLSAPISKGQVDRDERDIWHQQTTIEWIGREKLDFALEWHAGLLKRNPDLKLLTWCRFVPELRRYLAEELKAHPDIPLGAACGQSVLPDTLFKHLGLTANKKNERETALRLLHPKTAEQGPATVGATQGTGAIGLNFTACRTVLDMSYDYSPWKKKQGDARVNRPGQTGPVSFFYLAATGPRGQKTIDHHVMLTRLGKANINDWTVSAWVKALTED